MQFNWDQFLEALEGYLPHLVGAFAILVVGWLGALLVAAIVRGVLRKTPLDKKIAKLLGKDLKDIEARELENQVGKTVYYLLMLFVLVAFFQALGLSLITEPLNNLLNRLFEFLPRLAGGGMLLLAAWLIASLLRIIIARVLDATKLDERLGSTAGLDANDKVPLSKSLSEAMYWLVFLLFLPAILEALSLQGLLQPVQGMIDQLLGFLPNIFAAALILGLGWFVARIVQRVVTTLLSAVGADKLSERTGLATVLGKQQLSDVVGLVVYALILIPVLIASLNALELDVITSPASNMLNMILASLPVIFAAIVVLVLAYMVGRVVSGLVENVLKGLSFDSFVGRIGLVKKTEDAKWAPSSIVATLVMISIMLFAATEAFRLLGFTPVVELVSQFTVFAGHVLLGIVIFGVGLYLANLAAKAIEVSAATQSNVLAMVARIAILVLATAMALQEMGLANEIINMAFGILLGAVAVAAAIAFGVGGRDVAGKELKRMIDGFHSGKS
jgi:hypothetical protein